MRIEFLRKRNFRKEDRVAEIIAERGDHPGLVCILSAMESCSTYKPWHDKSTHRTFLKPDTARCLHYYFYFIDELFGLCCLHVPTWAPFRLQFYFNGHNLSAIDDPTPGINNLDKISRPAGDNHRTCRAFNLFHGDDLAYRC